MGLRRSNAYSGSGSFGAYGYSDDHGVSWNAFGTDNPYHMAVDVSAVPEPTTWALFATGLPACPAADGGR